MRVRNNILAILASIALLIVLSVGMSKGAFAASYTSVEDVVAKWGPGGSAGNTTWPSKLASFFTTNHPSSTEGWKQIVVHGQNYWYKESDTEAIIRAASALDGDQSIESLDDYYKLNADVGGASELIGDGFKKSFQVFLGLIVTLITVGMTIFTATDLCYIAFPVFRGKMDEAKASGTPGITGRNTKTGETTLRIVTEDAQYAMVAADMANTGRNPFLIYFKKRVVSFVVLAVLLFILLTGNINVITNIGVKLASGIINAINGSF